MAENDQIALYEELKHVIKTAHEITGGKCGISHNVLTGSTGEDWKTLHPIMKKLHEEKFFKVRKGINGRLFFYNEPTLNEP